MKLPKCACGCGKEVTKKRNKFIHGHQLVNNNPMHNTLIAKKVSNTKKRLYKEGVYLPFNGKENPMKNPMIRKKVSEKLKGRFIGENNPNYGNKWSEQMKSNLSKKRKKLIKEGKIKIPTGKNSPAYGNKWSLGRKISKETKMRISESHKKGIKTGKIKKTTISEEGRKRISERMKKNNPMFNPNIRQKMKETKKEKYLIGEIKPHNLGKKHSIITRKKMSEKAKTRKGIKNPFYGKKHTKEIKEKLRKINKKRFKENPLLIEEIKKARSKQILPIKDTSIEVKIQNMLKEIGYEFFTHQYIKEIEHGYQCDILIPALNLVIECDGNYWHNYPIGNEIDHIRTKELLKKGFKVLRLWESEIKLMNKDDLKIKIQKIGKFMKD